MAGVGLLGKASHGLGTCFGAAEGNSVLVLAKCHHWDDCGVISLAGGWRVPGGVTDARSPGDLPADHPGVGGGAALQGQRRAPFGMHALAPGSTP